MAAATLHKLADAEPIDPQTCLPQAKGLLSVAIQSVSGEVTQKQRPSASDVRTLLETVISLIADALRARAANIAASPGGGPLNDVARKHLLRALGSLRVIHAAAFIPADESFSGDVAQALNDEILGNALWAIADLVSKAEAA